MMYLRLFFEFFFTGLFSVGGGLATLPFLYDMSERTGWFTSSQLADMIAVSESTPGPIGVNMATYVGYLTGGIPGAIVATLGLICPAIVIIMLIAKVLEKFRQNKTVDSVFYGLRPCSVALIASAGVLVIRIALFNVEKFLSSGVLLSLFNFKAIALAGVLLVLTRWVKQTRDLHPIVFIGLSALVGIVFKF